MLSVFQSYYNVNVVKSKQTAFVTDDCSYYLLLLLVFIKGNDTPRQQDDSRSN